jgi:hypothetical protein
VINRAAATLLEEGMAMLSTGDRIELYDILRYVCTLDATLDTAGMVRKAIALLTSILTLIDTYAHGPGPHTIADIYGNIVATEKWATEFGLAADEVILSPSPQSTLRWTKTQNPTSTLPSLKKCREDIDAWREYIQWCEQERFNDRIRTRELDDQIRRGAPPVRGVLSNQQYQEALRLYEARSQYLRYAAELEKSEQLHALLGKLVGSQTTIPSAPTIDATRTFGKPTHGRYTKYSGPKLKTTTPLLNWIRTYERLCVTEGYTSDKEQIEWLSRALELDQTPLWTWYESIQNREHDITWEKVKESLIQTFMPASERQPEAIWRKISLLRREKNETIQQYQLRFSQMLEDLEIVNRLATIPFMPDYPLLTNTWLQGIQDASAAMQMQITSRDLSDIHEVMRRTVERVEELDNIRPTDKVKQPDKTETDGKLTATTRALPFGRTSRTHPLPPATLPEAPAAAPVPRSRFNPSTKSVMPILSAVTPTTASTTGTADSKAPSNPSGNKEDVDKKMDQLAEQFQKLKIQLAGRAKNSFTCFKCGEEGHTSRFCTSDTTLPTYRGYLMCLQDVEIPHEYNPENDELYLSVYNLALEYIEAEEEVGGEEISSDIEEGQDF